MKFRQRLILSVAPLTIIPPLIGLGITLFLGQKLLLENGEQQLKLKVQTIESRLLRDLEKLEYLNLSNTNFFLERILVNLETDLQEPESPEIFFLLDENRQVLIPQKKSGTVVPDEIFKNISNDNHARNEAVSSFFPFPEIVYLYTGNTLSNPAWTVLVAIPEWQLLQVLKKTFFLSISLNLLLLVIVSIILFRVSEWFTRPVSQLSQAVVQLASGKLNTRIPRAGSYEMEQLGVSFNHMATELQAFTGDLEDRIAQRTEELSTRMIELQETQNQLIKNEKLASLGSIVAGIAHEINTPLGVTVTAASFLEDLIQNKKTSSSQGCQLLHEDYTDVVESLRIIRLNLDKTLSLVKAFKQISVDQHMEELRHIMLKESLEEAVLMLESRFRKTSIDIIINCPDHLDVIIDPGALWQILNNLIINAHIHGFSEGSKGTIRISAGIIDDSKVQLKIIDNGSGIDDKSLEEIFEPFFTTNRLGGGTGLGLHLVHNLVTHRFHGSIRCLQPPDGGTEFLIIFPRYLS